MPKMYILTITDIDTFAEEVDPVTSVFFNKKDAEIAFDEELEEVIEENTSAIVGWDVDHNTEEWKDAYERVKDYYPLEGDGTEKHVWINGELISRAISLAEVEVNLELN